MKLFILYLAILFVCCVESFVLPVEKCYLEDSECMKTQFQKAIPVFMSGIPELGIQVLDVMEIEEFAFSLSGLQFSLAEGKLSGLKNAIIDNVTWNLKKKTCQIRYHLDISLLQGRYTASGKVLIMPVSGNGNFTMTNKNLQLVFDFEYEIVKKDDGKDYILPKSLHYQFDVIDNAYFSLTNLFNGDKELSDAFLTFVNENWKQITKEFGKPAVEVAAQIIFKNVKTFLDKNAINDIANYV